ncbi:lactate dehydrogenase [Carnobacterium divergens]|uniref:L-lactate dehydrogenase n=2 Tax=Carnobacterium divergens TaxID=2748 RepID=A0A0R2HPW3_CARDV|nr:lactate dehydrogenase [Carnobacterium divergens]AOA00132.1 lactate dehydrogenase [Carnobacterium divergens]KRN54510.1 L-lactate dehydrogenase [Carnobacterium divergens DSM 20623]MDO0873995.1 lactate dehydrogenase [Carnobacterium divergens]MDT1957494.1 lactate dehydrogenase [Carnobacterium divergens]MDT1973697.1 lactate dehydrogenase [Carnobacterium divergens]
MGRGHLSKVMVAGNNRTAYDFTFLSMLRMKIKELVLLDVPELDMAIFKDLTYTEAIFPHTTLKIGNEKDFQDTDLLIITACEERNEDETDKEYLRRNIKLVRKIINQAMANSFDGMVIIATEPTDIFTYLIWKFSGLPKERIFGLGTYFDTIYFQNMLSKFFKISVHDVKGYIVGGSQKNQKIAIWSRSYVGGTPVLGLTVDSDNAFNQEAMFKMEEMILKRYDDNAVCRTGYTNAATLAKLVQLISNNEEAIVPLVHLVDIDEYKAIPLSLPILLGENGISASYELGFSDDERQEILGVAKQIREQLDIIEQGK